MKSFLTIMALAVLAIMPAAFAESQPVKNMVSKSVDTSTHKMADKMKDKMVAEASMQKVNAVIFYSDTCGSCKILEPKVAEAMTVINLDGVNVVKLDASNSGTIEASKKLAADNGVTSTLEEYGTKTGFVVLVDDAGTEIAKLTKADSTADIAAKITASVLTVNADKADKADTDA